MRRTLGTAVFSGMLGVTLFGIFLTPVFFYVIDWLGTSPVFRSPGHGSARCVGIFWRSSPSRGAGEPFSLMVG